jgi:hypothetical protein
MFAEPTINDFICNIRWHLDKALTNARRKVEEAGAIAAQRGLSLSGNALIAIVAEVRREFEGGIEVVLGELKRAIRITKLDRNELRQEAVRGLENFAHSCKGMIEDNSFRQRLNLGNYIDENQRKFDEVLKFTIRQFDVGFFDPQEPEVPPMSNTINIGTMTGSAIQQGSPHAKQAVQMTLNVEAVRDALAAFEAAIQGTNLSENVS